LGLNSWSYGRLYVALSVFTTSRPTIVVFSLFLGNHDFLPEVAHRILLYLLLMEALNPSRAILGAKLMEQWPVICSIIGLYYK
jgi:hypothetical protein